MKNSRLIMAGYLATLVFITTLFLLSCLTPDNSFLLSYSSVMDLNDDWIVITEDTKIESADLPINKNVKKGEKIIIEKTLPRDFNSKQNLLIRSSLQNVIVYLDDEKIYELFFNDDSILKIPYASLWNIVEIPNHSFGKTVSIEFSSNFSRFSGVINPIAYGSVGGLNLYILKNYANFFAIALLIFLLGIILCIVPLFIKTEQKVALLFLGLFTITISIWFMAESRMVQFFTGNRMVLGSLAYLVLALLPVPLSMYIREVVSEKFKRTYSGFAVISSTNFFLLIVLQLSGTLQFYNSLVITHILMVFWLLVTISIIIYEIIKRKNIQARNIFYSSVFLILFAIAELTSFYMTQNTQVGIFLLVGVIIFISVQALTFLKQIQRQNLKSIEADMLRELAFKDYMTKGDNRLAFELEIEKVFSDREKLKHTGLVYFDVDGLKKINDELGHMKGDEAIILAFSLIEEVFGKFGKCYRIGGDEFAVLLYLSDSKTVTETGKKTGTKTGAKNGIKVVENDCNQSDSKNTEQKIEDLINVFHQKINDLKFKYEHSLAVSAGGILYDPKLDKDIKSIMSRADKAMYANKNKNSNNGVNIN